MKKITLACLACGAKARRPVSLHGLLLDPARCPKGHGLMVEERSIGKESLAQAAKRIRAERAAKVGKKRKSSG